MGGNTARRAHGNFSSATTCCCLLCRLPTARSCAPRPVRTPLLGAKLSPVIPTPPSAPKHCRSQIALRRRLRLPLPLAPGRCGCNLGVAAALMHYVTMLVCPWIGLLARRAKLVERAWCKVAREAVGPEGHVVPQQWRVNTTAPGVAPDDRKRLDLVIYGACDWVEPCAAMRPSCRFSREMASPTPAQPHRMRKPSACSAALRAHRAPPAMRAPAKAAWARRWWSVLSVAVQHAVGHTALGRAPAMPGPALADAPAFDEVMDLAGPEGPSCLPLH